MKDVVYITCDAKKENFIKLFDILRSGFISSNEKEIKFCEYKNVKINNEKTLKEVINKISKVNNFTNSDLTIKETSKIILNVNVFNSDSKFEISDVKYLLLLNRQLLKEKDGILVFTYDFLGTFIKLSGYMFLEDTYSNSNIYFLQAEENNIKRMARKFTLSKEWIVPMYMSSSSMETFNFMTGFLFKKDELGVDVLNSNINTQTYHSKLMEYWEDLKRTGTNEYEMIGNETEKVLSDYYRKFVLSIFEIIDIQEIKEYSDRFFNMPALALLIFALQVRALKKGTSKNNKNQIEDLLNNSFDYCECITQIAENMISHSFGGYVIVRINNNVDKLKQRYNIKKDLTGWHLDISVLDHSDKGIIENIKSKFDDCRISLKDVFYNEGESDSYKNIISTPDYVVHHYGLRVFANIVKEFKGIFRVISSKESKVNVDDVEAFWSEESEYLSSKELNHIEHIPGTEYEASIPISSEKDSIVNREKNYTPCIPINPIFDKNYDRKNILFDEKIYAYLGEKLNHIIKDNSDLDYQRRKEQSIEQAAEALKEAIIKKITYNNNYKIVYLVLDWLGNKIPQRLEVVAKIILKTILLIQNSNLKLKYVLYGISSEYINIFVRQFSLFYNRETGCEYMKNTQVFVISSNYEVEVLFAGENLESVLDYNKITTLNSGVPSSILRTLEYVVGTKTSNEEKKNYKHIDPVCFELLPRIEKIQDKYELSPCKMWYHKKLEKVLLEDIHNDNLGCCLRNTHIRINHTHLDRFYEAQLLFGNSYWCDVFSHYLKDVLLLDKTISVNKKDPILIVGYETYSEPMLFSFKTKLLNVGFKDVSYVIFENEKYITSKDKSPKQMRYLSNFMMSHANQSLSKTRVVFISGVSSTLSLMKNCLNEGLANGFEDKDLYWNLYKKGIVVIQIEGESKDQEGYHNKFISLTRATNTTNDNCANYDKVKNDEYLDFLNEKECSLLISVPAVWSNPEDCPICFPKDYKKEAILIETNETSTVPMLLIQPNEKKIKKTVLPQQTFANTFLDNLENYKYLYYSHIDRGGNHYQYYFRTANLIYDLLNEKEKKEEKNRIKAWFKSIKSKENIQTDTNAINIIVCPAHFSNETFTSAVNQEVFDGKAYIINFDAKKEFRQTFEANYANYKTAIDVIKNNLLTGLKLNFYYVDDQIVTGETFYRSKSLVMSLLNEHCFKNCEKNDVEINLFKAVIVVVNRNSSSSVCNYFDIKSLTASKNEGCFEIPFYSFLNFYTPSLRSYGDSCPICNKVNKTEILIEEASLTATANYWTEKKKTYLLKNLSGAKKEREEGLSKLSSSLNKEHFLCSEITNGYKYRGFRRLQCSEQIWKKIKLYGNKEIGNPQDAMEKIINPIVYEYMEKNMENNELMEYLISFVKVISRPLISYREIINSAALNFLLNFYSIITDTVKEKSVLLESYEKKIYDLFVSNETSAIKKYDAFRIIISSLCFVGSCWLVNSERLKECYTVGKNLEEKAILELKTLFNESIEENIKEIYPESFEAYLCLQIKKSFYTTRDTAIKMKKFNQILEERLEKILGGNLNE